MLKRLSQEYRLFVVTMSVVQYCSSLVLGALVLFRNTVDEAGGRVHMCGITSQVEELFAVTGMETLFNCFESESEAIANLALV